jgi:hypothetical protein
MDVTWSDPVASQQKLLLEKQYLSKLGKLMQRCSESLLAILSMHLRTLLWVHDKEYDHERIAVLRFALVDFYESVSTALDYTKIESMVRKSGMFNSFFIICLVRSLIHVGFNSSTGLWMQVLGRDQCQQ